MGSKIFRDTWQWVWAIMAGLVAVVGALLLFVVVFAVPLGLAAVLFALAWNLLR